MLSRAAADMSFPQTDIFRWIYDRAPSWLASLRTISKEVDQRHADIEAELGLPDLWPFGTDEPNNASTLSFFDSSAPALTFSASTAPTNPNISVPKPLPKAIKPNLVSEHSRRVSQQMLSAVVYDGEAQRMLSDIVNDIRSGICLPSHSVRRPETGDISRRLSEAVDKCHDAAFQLLRDGKCDPHVSAASSTFQDLFVISCIEVMHDRKARETPSTVMPTFTFEPESPDFSPGQTPELLPVNPVKTLHVPAVQVADLEDPVADDDCTSMDDFSIGPIRLTSRMR